MEYEFTQQDVQQDARIIERLESEIERLSLILNTLRGCLDNAVECLCMVPPSEDDEDDPDCHAGYCPVYMWSLLENWRTLQVKSNSLSD